MNKFFDNNAKYHVHSSCELYVITNLQNFILLYLHCVPGHKKFNGIGVKISL